MKRMLFVLIITLCCYNCQNNVSKDDDLSHIEKWKQEVYDAEMAFNKSVKDEGLAKAFSLFAAEDAVIKRKGRFILGRDSIKSFYIKSKWPSGSQTIAWKPDYIDVSNSGDMAYTYGKAVFTNTDSLGVITSSTGTFHTVWKRQKDDSWKFVWD